MAKGKVSSRIRYFVTPGEANADVNSQKVRGSNGRFYRVLKGNFKNSIEAKSAKAGKGTKFGDRSGKYREIRDALGLAAG